MFVNLSILSRINIFKFLINDNSNVEMFGDLRMSIELIFSLNEMFVKLLLSSSISSFKYLIYDNSNFEIFGHLYILI